MFIKKLLEKIFPKIRKRYYIALDDNTIIHTSTINKKNTLSKFYRKLRMKIMTFFKGME